MVKSFENSVSSSGDETFASDERLSLPAGMKQYGSFLVKACALIALLFVLGLLLPVMPPVCIAVTWAALSAAFTICFAYHGVIGKVHKQLILKTGGWLSKLNGGRVITLIVSFVLSAVLVAGLVLGIPKWGLLEWLLAILAIPLYIAVSALVGRLISDEYAPMVRVSKTSLWSSALLGLLLCVIYAIVLYFQPAVTYENITYAFLSADQPFSESPSALMSESGMLVALADGGTAYAMSEASKLSFASYIVWKVVLFASAYFGIANMIGFCSLDWAELKKVFLPLGEATKRSDHPLLKRYVAIYAILPICLIAAFVIVDARAEEALQTEQYTAVKSFLRDQVGIAVYQYDGHYYEWASIADLRDEAERKALALQEQAREELVPLINQSFDARIANVDSYLDWYYSLFADYERLASAVTGSAEDFVQQQFTEKIEQGIDDSELVGMLESYNEQFEACQAEIEETLAKYEISDVPDWLVVEVDPAEVGPLGGAPEPTQQFLNGYARLGVSAGTGVVVGVVAAKLVKNVMAKSFFKKMVAKIVQLIGGRAASAVGAGIGAAGGPVGAAIGFAAGVAVGVATDFGVLKYDEWQNRESYKEEIIAAIEEERASMLQLVGAA